MEPNQPEDPTKDKRIGLGFYGIAYSPADGSIWGSNLGFPGYVLRLDLGPNPSETALVEVYKVPEPGFGMRGFDVDRQGVAWVALASGHMASFDRRKCKGPLNGPGAAEGNLCPEGWTFYPLPGPGFKGRDEPPRALLHLGGPACILGLGDTPMGLAISLIHCTRWRTGRSLNCASPIPWASSPKGGRIDDPNAG